MYLQSDTGSVPRRSAHRYKQQHLVLNDSARSANAEMLAEAPEPTASPEPALLPASTSLAGWQGDDLGGTANPALKAGPVTFEQNTPTRQPPQPAVSGPTCGDSPQQDPMMQPLFPGALVTHEESLLLLMAHVLRHHGSKEATESLLKLLQYHLPEGSQLPATKYLFEKYFTKQEQPLTTHFYCPTCTSYIGVGETDKLDCVCGAEHSAKVLLRGGSYFLSLDWKAELCNLLANKGPLPEKPGLMFDVSDITQSPAYNQLPLGPDDVTLTWNTDGVPIFKSSAYSVWPLELMVCGLGQTSQTCSASWCHLFKK
ncbi:uncharacterized protein LOC115325530 [Ixodes scapularis]|nr:uncharacterized protein LOC120846539 [Ixodes scapularis]XP_040075986.1 uncharacterized protein LOC115325530 [Ixodes scapularis]